MSSTNGNNVSGTTANGQPRIIPYVDASTASPATAKALNTLPMQRNIFKLLANAEGLFTPFMTLLSACWSPNNRIKPSDWELIVLRTASTLKAPYEWEVNETTARLLGFDDAKLAAIRSGDLSDDSLFNDRERMVVKIVETLNTENVVGREMMQEAVELLGEKEFVEVTIIHGVYATLARLMQSAEITSDGPIEGLREKLAGYNKNLIEKNEKMKEAEDAQGRVRHYREKEEKEEKAEL